MLCWRTPVCHSKGCCGTTEKWNLLPMSTGKAQSRGGSRSKTEAVIIIIGTTIHRTTPIICIVDKANPYDGHQRKREADFQTVRTSLPYVMDLFLFFNTTRKISCRPGLWVHTYSNANEKVSPWANAKLFTLCWFYNALWHIMPTRHAILPPWCGLHNSSFKPKHPPPHHGIPPHRPHRLRGCSTMAPPKNHVLLGQVQGFLASGVAPLPSWPVSHSLC